jgi:chemotaxis protein MotA
MAEAADPKKKAPAAAAAAPKRAGTKPDLATLGGIVVALTGLIGGLLLEKGSIMDVAQFTAAMIVFGGTFGAVLVTNPLPVFLSAMKALKNVFFEKASSTTETIQSIIGYATKARKNGIVSLESEAAAIADPFLRKALNLAVDGTDLTELRKMMEIDIALSEDAAEAEAKVWEAAGGYSPTVGIIGAVMGLIQVMKHLEDIKEVGHGIAVAFVATVYGVASANLFFLPASAKLRARMHDASVLKDMTLEGVIGIVEGLNPTLIKLKLSAYDTAPVQTKTPKAAKEAKAPAAAGKAGKAGTAPQPAAAKS